MLSSNTNCEGSRQLGEGVLDLSLAKRRIACARSLLSFFTLTYCSKRSCSRRRISRLSA